MPKHKLHERRDPQGPNWLMLVDSPHWPAGTVLQFIIKEWWHGHDCLSEFEEENKRYGCTTLHSEPHQTYISEHEVDQILKRKHIFTDSRRKVRGNYALYHWVRLADGRTMEFLNK